MAALWGV